MFECGRIYLLSHSVYRVQEDQPTGSELPTTDQQIFDLVLGLNGAPVTGSDYNTKHSFILNIFRTTQTFSKIYSLNVNDYFQMLLHWMTQTDTITTTNSLYYIEFQLFHYKRQLLAVKTVHYKKFWFLFQKTIFAKIHIKFDTV